MAPPLAELGSVQLDWTTDGSNVSVASSQCLMRPLLFAWHRRVTHSQNVHRYGHAASACSWLEYSLFSWHRSLCWSFSPSRLRHFALSRHSQLRLCFELPHGSSAPEPTDPWSGIAFGHVGFVKADGGWPSRSLRSFVWGAHLVQ